MAAKGEEKKMNRQGQGMRQGQGGQQVQDIRQKQKEQNAQNAGGEAAAAEERNGNAQGEPDAARYAWAQKMAMQTVMQGRQQHAAARRESMQAGAPGNGGMSLQGADMSAQSEGLSGGMTTARPVKAIGEEQLLEAMARLKKYKGGKASVERRIIASQQWWKLKNWEQIESKGATEKKPASGWLWSAIVGKHADAVEAMPEPVILPRALDDEEEATRLSKVVPVVMQQNEIGDTYDEVQLQKAVEGTGIYGCYWDKTKLNGMGDISIKKVEALNLYWEPGVEDIQDSRDVFYVQNVDRDAVEAQYPQVQGKLQGKAFQPARYKYDDSIDESDKVLVIDWYYKKWSGTRKVLHYCKFCGTEVLYATENEPEMEQAGLYDDGEYPFVFDVLYKVAGSPCGYGYVDVGRDTQQSIDMLNQAMVQNAIVSATPRYFKNDAAALNEQEFADWTKPIIHVSGSMDSGSIMPVQTNEIGTNLINFMNLKTEEIKFITGNMDAINGGTSAGVTSASGLMAQIEAAGRTTKASTRASYRAYSKLVNMVIERIRQFYDMPRQFRITGEMGKTEFVQYDNSGIKPQPQGVEFGQDMGYRLPVFDIDVRAQKEQAYSKVAQNDLAIQLFQLGFFNPQLTEQALSTLEMMDFKGREEVEQRIQRNGTMQDMLMQMEQIALALAQKYEPDTAQELSSLIMQQAGQMPGALTMQEKETEQAENGKTEGEKVKDTIEKNAKTRVQNATTSGVEGGGNL